MPKLKIIWLLFFPLNVQLQFSRQNVFASRRYVCVYYSTTILRTTGAAMTWISKSFLRAPQHTGSCRAETSNIFQWKTLKQRVLATWCLLISNYARKKTVYKLHNLLFVFSTICPSSRICLFPSYFLLPGRIKGWLISPIIRCEL